MNLPNSYLPGGGGAGQLVVRKSAMTLVQLFYDNIMITLATDLVQQFYTHQPIFDNQVKPLKLIFLKMKLYQKTELFSGIW
jgi:hypothetical protein